MIKKIIINADDFGLSDSVNRAVAASLEKSLISDTTIMANGVCFEEAVALATEKGFSVEFNGFKRLFR